MLDNKFKTLDVLGWLQDGSMATALMVAGATGLMGGQAGRAIQPLGTAGNFNAAPWANPVTFDTGGGYTEGFLVIDVFRAGAAASNQARNVTHFNAEYIDDDPAVAQRAAFILQGSTAVGFGTWDILSYVRFGVDASGTTVSLLPANWASTPNWSANATYPNLYEMRYIVPFHNMVQDKLYRFLRIWCAMAGTWGTGLLYTAFLTGKN